MRTFALIGAILVLLLPFSIAWNTYELGNTKIQTRYSEGLVYYDVHSDGVITGSHSESFSGDWTNKDGVYASYFSTSNDDSARFMGIVIIILLIASIAFAVVRPDNLAAVLLIVCGVLLLILRFRALDHAHLSFYKKTDNGILGTGTYIEIPLGFILSLIFGILDLRKGDR